MHKQTSLQAIVCVALTVTVLAWGQRALAQEPWLETAPVRIIPYVDVRGVYDSNIDRVPTNEEDETFADTLVGINLGYAGTSLNLLLAGFASRRWHMDETDRDFESAGQGLRLRYGSRETLLVQVNQSYRRVSDSDTFSSDVAVGGVSPDSVLDVASRQRRDILQAALMVGFDPTAKTELDASYRFDTVDYNDRGLLQLTSHTAQLEAASKATDKTATLLQVRGGIQDSDAVDDSADFYSASLGIRVRGTDKLNLRATGGFQQYNRPGDADSVDSFVYSALATLSASDKVTLRAGARNGTQLSSLFAGNGTEYMIFWLGAALQASPAVRLSLNAAYREDEYLDPVAGMLVDRTDKGTAVRLRADYQAPSDYLSLYSEILFENVDSNARDFGYDQTRVSLGMRIQY